MTDRMTIEDVVQAREALECSFANLARTYDRTLTAAVDAWPAAERHTVPHEHYQCELLKAIMFARFPEAAAAWFA